MIENYGTLYYSNCILEALKAKFEKMDRKVYFLLGYVDNVPIPHMFWEEDGYYYNFYAPGDVHLYNVLWHKGCIQRFPKSDMHKKLYRFC